MALDSSVVWEVQTGGNDDNGGGYDSDDGGTDYSQQAAAELTLTDLACVTASTTLTSATGGFTAAMIDNLIQIKSGTNFVVGFYQITGHTDTNTVTIDRTASDGSDATSGTGSVGGALASPGMAWGAISVNGQYVYIKAGTYVLTTSDRNVSGGGLGDNNSRCTLEGYQTDRGDLGTKPVIQVPGDASITTYIVIDMSTLGSTDNVIIINVEVDGNSQTAITGFKAGLYVRLFKCKAYRCNYGFNAIGEYAFAEADTCSVGFFNTDNSVLFRCIAHGCSSDGFDPDGNSSELVGCLSYDNGGHGFLLNNSGQIAVGCVADHNTGIGFSATGQSLQLYDCVATQNTGYGFNLSATSGLIFVNCAAWSNTAGNRDADLPQYESGYITLTGNPWVDSGAFDYRPNDIAGAGAELRGAGIGAPSQTDNHDIGAVQHSDSGGTTVIVVNKKIR